MVTWRKRWPLRPPPKPEELDKFTRSYIETALWSSTDEVGVPLDENYDIHDIAPETLRKMAEDTAAFQESNWDDIKFALERAGHDFWLTRNRHGAGFWDGDWPRDVGRRLTEESHPYGTFDLYVGDDGKIHGQ